MRRNEKQFLTFCSGYVVIILAVTVLFFCGFENAAWIVGNPGTALWTFGGLFYVVFADSKRRWPDVPWSVRMGRVMSFYRD